MAIDFTNINMNDHDFYNTVPPEQIITDYRIAYRSRQMSLIGRQEVLSGRAKFGIFGDGKELPQVAMAHVMEKGDFRSGYYRDQTLMLALGEITVPSFFAQLYAHTDLEMEPASAGRLMNAHFATRSLNPDGSWRNLTEQFNSAADISPTAGQMPRLVGLSYASRLYRELDELKSLTLFSNNGNEVAFGTIGNASCAEGMFWEAINAIGVLRSPAVISIWDDEYGISVKNEHQILKEDLSVLLEGFQRQGDGPGFDIYTVAGWDYPALLRAYKYAAENARLYHIPAIIHVVQLTQPQGHSTSGSHERYKSKERLEWEAEKDCLTVMRNWMLSEEIITAEVLTELEAEDLQIVRQQQKMAWQAYANSITQFRSEVEQIIKNIAEQSTQVQQLKGVITKMVRARYPKRKDIMDAIFNTLLLTRDEDIPERANLIAWRDEWKPRFQSIYSTHLYSEGEEAALLVKEVQPKYQTDVAVVSGFEILNRYFDAVFQKEPRLIAMGEDVGYLGGVNQTMAGLQARYGELRVSDTGIRETTILGQAIGMAMRGLRPIAEIQYLDYVLYALQTISDDLATLRWRTHAGQKAPVIIRTRGHRLEGVWHSGSLMAGIINLVRGIHVLVPRDMTRAAGFYNTLLQSDDPGLVVEVLNGYRKKEPLPINLSEIAVPIGVPEVLREGSDVTLVTYGAMCSIVLEAAEDLHAVGIEAEVIDVQSLLPFDIHGRIGESVRKTSRLVCIDEDVPGGTSAYMLQQILEVQGGYHWLDSEPRTLTGKAHRPAYGTDGDYFSKPNKHDVFEAVYELMNEANPARYPVFYTRQQQK
ncbi:MAG: alpha-ketoacid dehydrogenase subunit alpha/beta [Chloroflexota bacterium]